MKRFHLRESEPMVLALSDVEAEALRRLGKALKGKQASWLAPSAHESERSAISCVQVATGGWRVDVSNCVGVVRVGDTQIEVEPKIPLDHLVFLMRAGIAAPRSTLDGSPGASTSTYLWDLVAEWYVNAAEQLLRRGLLKDYRSTIDEVQSIQGSPQPLETAQLFYRGVLGAVCEFDEFDEDSPLNRVVAAAARAVASSPLLGLDLRRRALRVHSRFDHVSDLLPGDLLVQVDRRSHYYGPPLNLAKHVLASIGRLPTSGEHLAWSFLIPTPNMVESGLRALLALHLAHRKVRKEALSLGGSQMTVNPDLVFDDDLVVGDIKYKTEIVEWSRSDLNQTVAFATAFRASAGVVIAFGDEYSVSLPTPVFGDLPVKFVRWCASASITPEAASLALASTIEDWLEVTERARRSLSKFRCI